MLSRSVLILPAFMVIVLAIVIGYVVLGLRGPERELRDARHANARQDYAAALRHLNRVKNEADLGDLELQENVTRRRALTYELLGNRRKAILDLKFLIDDMQIRATDLVHDRIRLLNEVGEEEGDAEALDQAERYCQQWLAKHGDDRLVMGQAGRSRHLMCNLQVAEWMQSFDSLLPKEHRKQVDRLVHRSIFSTNPDQGLSAAIERMSLQIDRFIPGFSDRFYPNVSRFRKTAATARTWFLRALSGPRSDHDAYLGLADQLRSAGDDDTLLMLAHVHLSRARQRDSIEPAFDIADIHLRHQRFQAVVAVVNRALPAEHIQPRFHDGSFDYTGMKLLACQAIALAELKDAKASQRLVNGLGKIAYKSRLPYPLVEARPYTLTHFVLGMAVKQPRQAAGHLNIFTLKMRGNPWFLEHLATYAFRRLASSAKPNRLAAIYERWIQHQRLNAEPILALAELELGRGDPTAANRVLTRAVRRLPDPDESLELLIRTQLQTSRLDLDAATKRTLELGKTLPDDTGAFPALTIAFARRALDTNRPTLALACAKRAKQLYPGSRIPFYLHAQTLLAMRRPAAAAKSIRVLLEREPNDPGALRILATARQATGESTDDLLFATILNGEPDLPTTRYLARQWLARGEYARVLAIAGSATSQFGIDLEMQVLATRALVLDPNAGRSQVLTMLRAVFHLSRGVEQPSVKQAAMATWALGQFALHNPEKLSDTARRGLITEFLNLNQSATELLDLAEKLTEQGEFKLALQCYRDLAQDDRYKESRLGVHLITAARVALRLDDIPKARELLAAALAFDDGSPAAIDLALLDLATGDTPRLPDKLAVDDVLSASLAARRGAKAVIPFLAQRLQANPTHLACQCIGAVLNEKAPVSPHVRALAASDGPELLTLVALLERPAFGKLAARRAAAMVAKNPTNPAACLLLAKAHGHANQPIKLQAAFDRIRHQLLQDPVLMAAGLQILSESNHPALQHSKIRDQMASLALRGGVRTPPALLAMVLRQNAAILRVPGARDKILPLVQDFWLAYPVLSKVGLDEVELLVLAGQHAKALELLRKIEALLPAAQHDAYLDLYYRAASAYAETAKIEDRDAMIAEALLRLQSDPRVNGAALHFLLGWLDRAVREMAGTSAGEAAHGRLLGIEGQYLQRHIDECPLNSPAQLRYLQLTLTRIGAKRGLERAMETVESLLRRDPSLIPIWRLRARWLVQLGQISDATNSLLWMPRFLDSPEIVDILVQLLARSGQLVEKGQQLLTTDSLATASKLSLGLAQLRVARYGSAARSLVAARAQPDGAHLYYRAMALLALHDPAASKLARQALLELLKDYSQSNFANSAATVAAVL